MAIYTKLCLRELNSPYGDMCRNSTLSFADLDQNFIYLKGELVKSAKIENGVLILTKINDQTLEVDLSVLTQANEDSLRVMADENEEIKNKFNTDVTNINTTINEIKDGIESNTIWEWGSGGVKSIKVKNGSNNDATGDYSVSEGYDTKASGDYSNAEGVNTTASGNESHAEGSNTTASGRASHAGGASSYANGDFSFAHSKESKADGESSVVLGGNLNVVEGGGENSGVLLGNTNRILGLDYEKLINDTENEINILKSEREKEHAEFIKLESDLKEQLDKKREQIGVLKSEIDNQLYTGYSSDLRKRLKDHNRGNVKSTQNRRPLKLVYFEGCLNQ